MGAAYGTAKAGIGIAGIGTYRPDLIMKVRSGAWHSAAGALSNVSSRSSPSSCPVSSLSTPSSSPSSLPATSSRRQTTRTRCTLGSCTWLQACLSACPASPRATQSGSWEMRYVLERSTAGHALISAGCTLLHAPVEDLCRHGPHPHFRRGPGSLRVCLRSVRHVQCSVLTL
jgi:hypothetical protein